MRHGLLAAYDAQLREASETNDSMEVRHDGPLLIARYMQGRGFVTYRSLGGLSLTELDALVARTVASFEADPDIVEFEWKTRDHDEPRGLGALLTKHGLQAEERETVMAGPVDPLVGHDEVPEGVTVRRAGDRGDVVGDVERIVALQNDVFGTIPHMVDMTLRRLASPYVDLWYAEAGGEVVGSGRLDRVPGTDFAGLWGGAVRADWRHHGVYRALTQARARAALDSGARYLYADCTVMSRVILESCGLVPITTTVPYIWRRTGSLPQQ